MTACTHQFMKVVIRDCEEVGRLCPDCGYTSGPTPGDKIRESFTAIGSQFAGLGFRVDVNPIYGPGDDDYGRRKPFNPPELTPDEIERLRKSLDNIGIVTEPVAKPIEEPSSFTQLGEIESWRSKVVWGFHEDAYPQYIQGKAGENEITSELTADEANRLVKRSLVLEAELAKETKLRKQAEQFEAVCHCGNLVSQHSQSDNHGAVAMDERCHFEIERDKALAELADISSAIGSDEFMDPPDGGSVTLAEQVKRMREALETARLDARLSAGCNKAACDARDKALDKRDELAALLHEKVTELKKEGYHGTGSWVDRVEHTLLEIPL